MEIIWESFVITVSICKMFFLLFICIYKLRGVSDCGSRVISIFHSNRSWLKMTYVDFRTKILPIRSVEQKMGCVFLAEYSRTVLIFFFSSFPFNWEKKELIKINSVCFSNCSFIVSIHHTTDRIISVLTKFSNFPMKSY